MRSSVSPRDIDLERFSDWLGHGENFPTPYSTKTRRVYRSVVQSLLGFMEAESIQCFGEFNVAWLRRFVSRAHRADGSCYSASYQIVRLSALNAFWFWLAEEHSVLDNPAARYVQERRDDSRRPAGGNPAKRLPEVLDWAEQRSLLATVQRSSSRASIRDYAMISLILATGLRCDEVCRADASRTDFAGRRLRVIGKGNKERLVDFSHDDAVLGAMEMWLPERARLLEPHGRTEDALFVSMTGRRMTGSLIYQQVARYLRSAGLDGRARGMGGHLLRHTATSIMFARNVPVLQIQQNLGHENLSTTQIYAHLLPPPKSPWAA